MSSGVYTVRLSREHGASVSVEAEDVPGVKAGLRWANKALDDLQKDDSSASVADGEDKSNAPVCEIHGVPMVRQKGKYGWFFSCHEKLPDGSFCSYKPSGE